MDNPVNRIFVRDTEESSTRLNLHVVEFPGIFQLVVDPTNRPRGILTLGKGVWGNNNQVGYVVSFHPFDGDGTNINLENIVDASKEWGFGGPNFKVVPYFDPEGLINLIVASKFDVLFADNSMGKGIDLSLRNPSGKKEDIGVTLYLRGEGRFDFVPLYDSSSNLKGIFFDIPGPAEYMERNYREELENASNFVLLSMGGEHTVSLNRFDVGSYLYAVFPPFFRNDSPLVFALSNFSQGLTAPFGFERFTTLYVYSSPAEKERPLSKLRVDFSQPVALAPVSFGNGNDKEGIYYILLTAKRLWRRDLNEEGRLVAHLLRISKEGIESEEEWGLGKYNFNSLRGIYAAGSIEDSAQESKKLKSIDLYLFFSSQ